MCGECCKGYGGTFVNQNEIEAISQYLKTDPESFVTDYCQLSGRRPPIKTAESGYCIFWDKVCTIHRVKPRMCKIWPFVESILVDSTNWAIIQSMCPGVRADVDLQDLTQCVRQVLTDYERQWGR